MNASQKKPWIMTSFLYLAVCIEFWVTWVYYLSLVPFSYDIWAAFGSCRTSFVWLLHPLSHTLLDPFQLVSCLTMTWEWKCNTVVALLLDKPSLIVRVMFQHNGWSINCISCKNIAPDFLDCMTQSDCTDVSISMSCSAVRISLLLIFEPIFARQSICIHGSMAYMDHFIYCARWSFPRSPRWVILTLL